MSRGTARSHMREAMTQISLQKNAGCSKSLLCALWVARHPGFLQMENKMFCIECGDAQTDLSLHWVHKHAHRKCCVQAHILLTLKAPRKTASENVVFMSSAEYSCKLYQTYFCIQANSVDPDQTAPKGAVWSWSTLWSGSTLFAEMTFKITSRMKSRRQ